MGDNNNERNNGVVWDGREETWGRGEEDDTWRRQIDEDNARAAEVRNVVAELLGRLAAVGCPGLIVHISEFVGNRLIALPGGPFANLHMGPQAVLDENGLLPRREVAEARFNAWVEENGLQHILGIIGNAAADGGNDAMQEVANDAAIQETDSGNDAMQEVANDEADGGNDAMQLFLYYINTLLIKSFE